MAAVLLEEEEFNDLINNSKIKLSTMARYTAKNKSRKEIRRTIFGLIKSGKKEFPSRQHG